MERLESGSNAAREDALECIRGIEPKLDEAINHTRDCCGCFVRCNPDLAEDLLYKVVDTLKDARALMSWLNDSIHAFWK